MAVQQQEHAPHHLSLVQVRACCCYNKDATLLLDKREYVKVNVDFLTIRRKYMSLSYYLQI